MRDIAFLRIDVATGITHNGQCSRRAEEMHPHVRSN